MIPAADHENLLYNNGYDYVSLSLMRQIQDYAFLDSHLKVLGVTNSMADQDDSRTNSVNEQGSSSKEINTNTNTNTSDDHNKVDTRREREWLQLGIGGYNSTKIDEKARRDQEDEEENRGTKRGLVELDLLSSGSPYQQDRSFVPNFQNPEFQSPQSLFYHQHQQQQQMMNWGFRPLVGVGPTNIPPISSSSSSFLPSLMPLTRPSFGRPFHIQGSSSSIEGSGSNSDFRIIDPPKRPQSGIWFLLQALQNQAKEPFLPQIPKSYLRIKDEGMTVRLLLRYLVKKLRLDNESQIEIRCRGHQIEANSTLQDVRDTIWCNSSQRESSLSISQSSTIDHLMILHYGRSA